MGALLVGLIAAAASAAPHPGKALFDSHGCRSCHAVGGVGGNVGPDLSAVGFRRGEAWIEKWLSSPRHWKPDTLMPDPKLADGDLRALAAYLGTLRSVPAARDGRTLFAKAGCSGCHGAAGRGGHPDPHARGGVVPALRDTAGTYTLDELKAKIRRGVAPENPEAEVRMPSWGEILSEDQIAELAGYVLSLAPKAKGKEW